MAKSETEKTHSEVALELANQGIAFDARGSYDQSARSWEAASDYADMLLAGEDIYYWIKSGLGAALYEIGAYRRSITVSEIALDWCSKIKQPLPAMTIAKCYLRLGNRQAARKYLDHSCRLAGDAVLEQLDPDDRVLVQRG